MKIELRETRRQSEDTYESIGYAIELDGVEIGSATVIASEGQTAYIERIDIDEAHRGQGCGTAALEQLSDSFGGIYIAPDSADSQRLYARLGRQVSGLYYDEEYEDEVMMTSGDYADDLDQGFGVYEI